MNRLVAKLLMLAAAMLVCLSVAACGSSNHDDFAYNGSKNGSEQEKEITLKFYFGGEKKAATDEVWSEVSRYVKSKGLNVKFDINFIPFSEYREKMLAMAAAGDTWDMNFDGDWLSYKLIAAKGSYMALNELLPKYAPNLLRKYKEQGTLSAATVNGQIVGLPWTMKMNERKFAGWRVDLAEKAGLTIEPDSIKTIEDVDWLLRELKKAYPNEKLNRTPPLSLFFSKEEWVDMNFHGLGFYWNDPEITVRAVEQQPFYLESAKLSKVWYDDRLINRDAIIDKGDASLQWRNGKSMFTITSHEWANADPGFVDPTYKQGMSLLYPDKKFVNRSSIANVVAINRNSKNPDRVLRFLDMLETDRTLYDLVIYGIEGKTYLLNGEAADYPEGMQTSSSNYMEWGGQWAFWKPQFMRPTATYGKNFWVKEEEFANESFNVISPLDGLFIAEDGMKDELAVRDQLGEEYGRPIEYGTVVDVEQSVAYYIELQKNNGLAKILARTQAIVDEYLASKG
ncbi:extracellular solute-binding protein [Paenibacillus sp. NPDC058174]|uniref:extracellular solute-binding protein n=1 Tax=Paenibacillus sp. NPDC058174 TaxID=3346366 RepID=UPI0036D79C1C